MSLFLDTNVLVYSIIKESRLGALADKAIVTALAQGEELWISRQVIRELLKALINSIRKSGLNDSAAAIAAVTRCTEIYSVADEYGGITEKLLHLVRSHNVPPHLIHDANIVATMRVYGIGRLLTHNVGDFERFSDLIEIVPLEALS